LFLETRKDFSTKIQTGFYTKHTKKDR